MDSPVIRAPDLQFKNRGSIPGADGIFQAPQIFQIKKILNNT